jgi:hypothetical protein
MKKLACFLCLVLLLSFCVDARIPKKGDHVQVLTTSGKVNVHVYEGNITDISDGLLCMNCTKLTTEDTGKYASGMKDVEGIWDMDFYTPCDVCIGTGQIIALVWPDDANIVRYITRLDSGTLPPTEGKVGNSTKRTFRGQY